MDIRISDHGTIVLLHPITNEGRAWLREHVVTESWSMFGEAIAAEPRYVPDIVESAREDGLEVA